MTCNDMGAYDRARKSQKVSEKYHAGENMDGWALQRVGFVCGPLPPMPTDFN